MYTFWRTWGEKRPRRLACQECKNDARPRWWRVGFWSGKGGSQSVISGVNAPISERRILTDLRTPTLSLNSLIRSTPFLRPKKRGAFGAKLPDKHGSWKANLPDKRGGMFPSGDNWVKKISGAWYPASARWWYKGLVQKKMTHQRVFADGPNIDTRAVEAEVCQRKLKFETYSATRRTTVPQSSAKKAEEETEAPMRAKSRQVNRRREYNGTPHCSMIQPSRSLGGRYDRGEIGTYRSTRRSRIK